MTEKSPLFMVSLVLLLIGMLLVLGSVLLLRLPAFLALIFSTFVVAFLTPISSLEKHANELEERVREKAGEPQSPEEIIELDTKVESARATILQSHPPERIAEGLGKTATQIGIIIAMASIIGHCLLESGAAQRIVEAILHVCGVARAQLAFLASGFLLAIPVFFDTVFYLLMPLGKAMGRRTGKHYLLYILTIVAGGTMAHSLVPPTPGPLFVAEALDVELGVMILAGMIVGLGCVGLGYLYALWVDRHWEVPLREPETEVALPVPEKLPPLFWSLLPILLPLVLITSGSILSIAIGDDELPIWVTPLLILQDKNLALTLAAVVALLLLVKQRWEDRSRLGKGLQTALGSGANIILITAAGGAFGAILNQTGIGSEIRSLFGGASSTVALPIVFFLTALVRTAQGSATVAMFTAAPVAVAFLPELSFHPVYLALAIGCGSKPIPWMNDSGFWIITKMSGMTESETLRFVTPMMSGMGVVGLVLTMLGAWWFPLM